MAGGSGHPHDNGSGRRLTGQERHRTPEAWLNDSPRAVRAQRYRSALPVHVRRSLFWRVVLYPSGCAATPNLCSETSAVSGAGQGQNILPSSGGSYSGHPDRMRHLCHAHGWSDLEQLVCSGKPELNLVRLTSSDWPIDEPDEEMSEIRLCPEVVKIIERRSEQSRAHAGLTWKSQACHGQHDQVETGVTDNGEVRINHCGERPVVD